jgi:hypothetical protein
MGGKGLRHDGVIDSRISSTEKRAIGFKGGSS